MASRPASPGSRPPPRADPCSDRRRGHPRRRNGSRAVTPEGHLTASGQVRSASHPPAHQVTEAHVHLGPRQVSNCVGIRTSRTAGDPRHGHGSNVGRASGPRPFPPPATRHPPPATGHRPPATGHRPPATGHRPQATVHRPPSTGHRPQATVHRPPSTGHRPQATGNRPLATVHWSPARQGTGFLLHPCHKHHRQRSSSWETMLRPFRRRQGRGNRRGAGDAEMRARGNERLRLSLCPSLRSLCPCGSSYSAFGRETTDVLSAAPQRPFRPRKTGENGDGLSVARPQGKRGRAFCCAPMLTIREWHARKNRDGLSAARP